MYVGQAMQVAADSAQVKNSTMTDGERTSVPHFRSGLHNVIVRVYN